MALTLISQSTTPVYGPNVCTGGTPIESGHSASQIASLAFDGSTATYWASLETAGAVLGVSWIGYDFGPTNLRHIRQIQFYNYTNTSYNLTSVKAQSSADGVTWTTIVTQTVSTLISSWQIATVPVSAPARYWRLLANGSPVSNWQVCEVNMFEIASPYLAPTCATSTAPSVGAYSQSYLPLGHSGENKMYVGTSVAGLPVGSAVRKAVLGLPLYPPNLCPFGIPVESGHNSAYVPSNAFNGATIGGVWSPSEILNNQSGVSWLGMDFGVGVTRHIRSIALFTYSAIANNMSSIKVQNSSDGTTWTDVGTTYAMSTAVNSWVTASLPASTASRYWRILANANVANNWFVFELQMMEAMTNSTTLTVAPLTSIGSITAVNYNNQPSTVGHNILTYPAPAAAANTMALDITPIAQEWLTGVQCSGLQITSDPANADLYNVQNTAVVGQYPMLALETYPLVLANPSTILNSGQLNLTWVKYSGTGFTAYEVWRDVSPVNVYGSGVKLKTVTDVNNCAWSMVDDLQGKYYRVWATNSGPATVCSVLTSNTNLTWSKYRLADAASFVQYEIWKFTAPNFAYGLGTKVSTIADINQTIHGVTGEPSGNANYYQVFPAVNLNSPTVFTSNACVNGTVMESGHNGANISANAFDGVTTGVYWASSEITANQSGASWIGYDFGTLATKHIRQIILYQGASATNAITSIKVQSSSNGTAWSSGVVLSPTATAGAQVFTIPTSGPFRYWRMLANANCTTANFWQVFELQMMEAAPALVSNSVQLPIPAPSKSLVSNPTGSVVVADYNCCGNGLALENGHYASYVPSQAFDGLLTTAWGSLQATGHSGVSWIGYDFGAIPRHIRNITVSTWTVTVSNMPSVLVQYSPDAVTWTTVAALTLVADVNTVTSYSIPASGAYRYWRIMANANLTTYWFIPELQMAEASISYNTIQLPGALIDNPDTLVVYSYPDTTNVIHPNIAVAYVNAYSPATAIEVTNSTSSHWSNTLISVNSQLTPADIIQLSLSNTPFASASQPLDLGPLAVGAKSTVWARVKPDAGSSGNSGFVLAVRGVQG